MKKEIKNLFVCARQVSLTGSGSRNLIVAADSVWLRIALRLADGGKSRRDVGPDNFSSGGRR